MAPKRASKQRQGLHGQELEKNGEFNRPTSNETRRDHGQDEAKNRPVQ